MIIKTPKKEIVYKTEKKEIMPFDKAFQRLRIMDAKAVRLDICNLLNISSAYFTMKKNGVRGVSRHEKSVIKSTFNHFGIDAFPGETTNQNN